MKRLIITLITLILLTGCAETNTTDPKDSYKYWSGSNPSDELEIVKGQYWQSGHWTREYIMYLKLKPTKIWWNEFIEQNQLQIDNENWSKPSDAPSWFNPTEKSIKYSSGDNFDQGSRYFKDTLTGDCYIYEIQL